MHKNILRNYQNIKKFWVTVFKDRGPPSPPSLPLDCHSLSDVGVRCDAGRSTEAYSLKCFPLVFLPPPFLPSTDVMAPAERCIHRSVPYALRRRCWMQVRGRICHTRGTALQRPQHAGWQLTDDRLLLAVTMRVRHQHVAYHSFVNLTVDSFYGPWPWLPPLNGQFVIPMMSLALAVSDNLNGSRDHNHDPFGVIFHSFGKTWYSPSVYKIWQF